MSATVSTPPAKLFFTPTCKFIFIVPCTLPNDHANVACGAASYIAAHKAGLIASGKVVGHKVDIGPAKIITETGASFLAINPKGNVPALVLPDGTLLNEGEKYNFHVD